MTHLLGTQRRFLAALLVLGGASTAAWSQAPVLPHDHVRVTRGITPLTGFVANHGQWADDVLFFAQAGGIEATVTREAFVFRPAPPDPQSGAAWPAPLVLRLPRAVTAQGEAPVGTLHHFLLGSGRTSHVPGFAQVVARDVGPGVDLVLRKDADGRTFAYDVHAAPGARLEDLVLELEGASGWDLADGGRVLALATAAGRVEQRIGATWQEDGAGRREEIEATFRILGAGSGVVRVSFDVPGRDPARKVVVDPSLAWATYLGGTGGEELHEMIVGPSGAVYVTCRVGTVAPTTHGAFQTISSGQSDAWLAKLSADASELEWATFLGGSLVENDMEIALAQDESVIVAGVTWSADFPTTPGSLQPNFAGSTNNNDTFVTKLSADGSSLTWSTFYSGPNNELWPNVAVFPNGDVLVTAEPTGAEPSATPGAFDPIFDPGDQFIARIRGDGAEVVFQTYFAAGRINDVLVDASDHIYLAGDCNATDKPLPTTPEAFQPAGASEGFVAKLSGAGDELVFATYLGGADKTDDIWGIAVDAASAVYVVGQTLSDHFPVTPGAFSPAPDGSSGFVTKLLPRGTGLVWSTYFGATCCMGVGIETDVAVDRAGNVWSAGWANQPEYPTTADALQPSFIGPFPTSDSHLAKFDAFGETLIYSSWFGGSGSDNVPKIGLSPDQSPILAVQTTSKNIPTTPNVYDPTHSGSGQDLALAKFELPVLPWEVLGNGKRGTLDVPNLAGGGWLVPGSPARLSARGAAPDAPAIVFAGVTALNAPVLGGTFVPAPDLYLSLTTDASGGFDLLFMWPDLPAGIDIYVQAWIADRGVTLGWSASNALKMTSQ